MSGPAEAAAWWTEEVLDRERLLPLVGSSLERLRSAQDRGRFPQSLLLVGPPGLGRELVATEAAASLTCPEGEIWCECSSCRRVRQGSHPDVALVLPRGKGQIIKIDPVREVVAAAAGRPYEAPRRVWIFAGVERRHFGAEAANAFLKTLEEPPERTFFILLAANPTAVLATILSRCQRLVLPGPVAAGVQILGDRLPPELATAVLAGADVEGGLADWEESLRAAVSGEPLPLLRSAHRWGDEAAAFEVAAEAALALATEHGGSELSAGLIGLANDLLAVERRARQLNLNRQRQLLSCHLRWYKSLR